MSLVRENEYLVVYFPPKKKALVFRVVSIANNGYNKIVYGPIPISSGASLPTYDGGSTTVPENGVLPGRAFIRDGITFPMSDAYDESDMWYIPEEWRDRLFHVIQYVKPGFLRIDAQIPPGVSQPRFQKDKVVGGVDRDFGFRRGSFEMVHLPGIEVGYRYGNDTNLDVYTLVKFVYAECIVEIPRDAETIHSVLMKKVPGRWFTYPISYLDPRVEIALSKTYGIDGFPLIVSRDTAIKVYTDLLTRVKG